MLTISGSSGHPILEKSLPSFLALANIFHVSSCSLSQIKEKRFYSLKLVIESVLQKQKFLSTNLRSDDSSSCVTTSYRSNIALAAPFSRSGVLFRI